MIILFALSFFRKSINIFNIFTLIKDLSSVLGNLFISASKIRVYYGADNSKLFSANKLKLLNFNAFSSTTSETFLLNTDAAGFIRNFFPSL